MRINVKNVDGLIVPTNGSPQAAAYDATATSDPEIVGEQVNGLWKRIDYIQYHTNLFVAPQKDNYQHDFHILIHPRSSVSKYSLQLANGIGLIDTDYRGEILVRFNYLWQPEDMVIQFQKYPQSDGPDVAGLNPISILGKVNTHKIYKKGDKICQLVVEPTTRAEWVPVNELSETVRGAG